MIVQVVVIAAMIVGALGVTFWIGQWYGQGRAAGVVQQLEDELRYCTRLQMPAEIAHEPQWVLAVPAADPRGYVAVPDWHAPGGGLDEWLAGRSAELQADVAAMIAASVEPGAVLESTAMSG